MNPPTAKQAQIFWLAATGMNAKQISEIVGISPQNAQAQLTTARSKAAKVGLKFTVTLPDNEVKVGSGMMRAKELAEATGLPKFGGFEALKKLAQEALAK
jgi:hypothetical protein